MLKKLLFIISLYCLFTANFAQANNCLDSLQSANQTCQQSYAYDVLVMYFKDASNQEHKVHVKRVRAKSTGTLVHADYDFVSNCTTNCASLDAIANDILWAFRNAYIADKFYQKVIYQCDPTQETCCDSTGCNEILGVEPLKDNAEIEAVNNGDNQYVLQSGSKHKNGDKIDKAISRTESFINIIKEIMDFSSNGQEVKQEMATVTAQPLQFIIINTVSGGTKVCALSGGTCNEIAGSVTASHNMASVDLHHSNGHEFNSNLQNFLEGVYQGGYGGYGLVCNQSMSCNVDGTNCTIRLRCIRN
ncbi:MAG: hypothetical protein ACPG5Z_16000 [Pseudoalteromonas sp.]